MFIIHYDDCYNTMDCFSVELYFIIIACLKFLNEIENIDLIRILQKKLFVMLPNGIKHYFRKCFVMIIMG